MGGQKMAPVFGQNSSSGAVPAHACLSQVTAVWQWWNFLHTLLPPGKTILRLNLDETAVRTYCSPAAGLICTHAPGRGQFRLRPVHQASRAKQRSCLSHIVFLCDDTAVQPQLPHIICGNKKVLPLHVQRHVQQHLLQNVFVIRRQSAWINTDLMVKVMGVLGHVLRPHLATKQPVLLLDALSVHIAPQVFRAAAKAGIWLVVIPAKLTFLLQPADTHAFYKYKMYLRRRYLEVSSDAVDGEVGLEKLLLAMNDGVRRVFQGHAWGRAFTANGFDVNQSGVRRKILDAMGVSASFSAPSSLPSLTQFQSIWPAGKEIPFDAVFAPFLLPAPPCPHPPPELVADHGDAESQEWSQRLRPRHEGRFLARTGSSQGLGAARSAPDSDRPAWPPHVVGASAPAPAGRRALRGAAPIPMLRRSPRSCGWGGPTTWG